MQEEVPASGTASGNPMFTLPDGSRNSTAASRDLNLKLRAA